MTLFVAISPQNVRCRRRLLPNNDNSLNEKKHSDRYNFTFICTEVLYHFVHASN